MLTASAEIQENITLPYPVYEVNIYTLSIFPDHLTNLAVKEHYT